MLGIIANQCLIQQQRFVVEWIAKATAGKIMKSHEFMVSHLCKFKVFSSAYRIYWHWKRKKSFFRYRSW